MHREIRSIDKPFAVESHALLYLFTLIIALLVGLDLWPWIAGWINNSLGTSLPAGSSTFTLWGYTIRWAMVAAVLAGSRSFYTSLESLLAGRIGAELALTVAMLAALLLNQPLVAAEVLFIGLVGECLEAYTFGRTQQAIRLLVETFPKMCLVYRNGEQVMVPLDDVKVGERVAVLPGKRVPVDGIIVEGSSSIDVSNLTGESMPVEKQPGDAVLAGTVNQFGALVVEVQRVSEQTVMGQVITATAQALQAKGKSVRTADELAKYFLPVVLGIAAITWLAQWWWLRGTGVGFYQMIAPALAVLVVACPCALILATPAATMAALARLAKTGILVKRGAALEQLADIQHIVFDKTGTLTTARLTIGKLLPLQASVTEDELLRWAATAEQQSEHPIAQTLVQAARQRQLELWAPTSTQSRPGLGVIAECQKKQVLVGTMRLLSEAGLPCSDDVTKLCDELDQAGQTSVLVVVDRSLVGMIGIWDAVRPDAAAVVQELKQLGLQVSMLSGDRAGVVRNMAGLLNIDQAVGECLPTQKCEKLAAWKQTHKVAMVGDGVNDAPALALADVGLAISSTSNLADTQAPRIGSDIAAESSDIVLLGDPLKSLPLLVRLSREMVTIIRQNILWFAFGVNAIGIALVGWLIPAWLEDGRQQSPLWAALYHQIGSLLVLLNSMRLLWFERKQSAWIQQWSKLVGQADANIEQFNLHDFSHWIYERGRWFLAGGLLLIVVAYAATSIAIVPAGSVGLVQRCGKMLDETLPPGLHWQWPWPWDQVTLVEPDLVRRVEVGFRRAQSASDAQTWSSEHRDNLLKETDEALLMTAEGNLIEAQATLLYTVSDPRSFVLGTAQVETVLRAQTEAALREVAAERRFEQLLAGGRSQFQQEALRRLQSRLKQYTSYLGIQIINLALEDLHPPPQVVKDYYEVTRALAARSRVMTEARMDREKNVSRETVNTTRSRAEVAGDTHARTAQVQAERDAFLKLAATQQSQLVWLAAPGAYGSIPVMLPIPRLSFQQRELLKKLTEFRLIVEAGETLLSQRPKVLRDPRLKGTLQIIPEFLRLKLPALGDKERTPPNPEMP